MPGASSFIYGINNAGTIAGQYTANSATHGFIANPSTGSLQTIDYPGSAATQLYAINNNGVVVGRAATSWFTRDAAGNFTPITVPSGYSLWWAGGINDNGAISVVVTSPSTGFVFGVLNPDGTLTPVPAGPGLTAASPSTAGINIADQMVETNGNFGKTFLVDTAGNVTAISFAGSPTYGSGLNNTGLLVGSTLGPSMGPPFMGFSRDSSGVYSGVICPGAGSAMLSGPKWAAVNDNGVVAGEGTIATPVPGQPNLSLSTTSVTFPPTPVGQTTAPQSVTITNTGNARLDIAGIIPPTSEFQALGCAVTAPVSLDPGSSCNMTVTAKPAAQGSRTGTISIIDSAAGAPHLVALSVNGTLTPPSCTISGVNPGPPEQLTFTMQDTNVGLKNITLVDATNATASIPAFPFGTKSPVTVTATQSNASQSSKVDFQVTNAFNGATSCGATFGGPAQWTGLGGSVNSKIAVARNTDGRLQAFVRGSDNALWTIVQASPDTGWTSWVSLGGVLAGAPAVGANQDGRLQVFVVGADSALWTNAQSSPGGSFSGWQSLGGDLISDPAVATDGNGDLDVVGAGGDRALWVIAQTSPGGPWSGWSSLGGVMIDNPALAANQDGRLEAFVLGPDNTMWTIAQSSPGGSWSGWTGLGGSLNGDPVLSINQDGRLQIFASGTDSSLWTAAQGSPGGSWSSFSSLGGFITSIPAAANNSDGRLEVFVRGGDNALWHLSQTNPGGGFSAWATLAGGLGTEVSAAQNQDGRVQAFVAGTDQTLWTIEQTAPGLWN